MAKKKLKPAIWPGHTLHEQRALELLLAAFGKHTVWTKPIPVPPPLPIRAKFTRCPECDTFFQADLWPRCGFCRFEDPGRWAA